jgi:ketopantoate reductase
LRRTLQVRAEMDADIGVEGEYPPHGHSHRTRCRWYTRPAAESSLQRDIAAGKPSELDAWTGAVVRLGRKTAIPTPLHSFLYASLLPLERRARGELDFAAR